jgi:hypothetical protein
VTIDCRDPTGLAAFWAALLGYVDQSPPEGYSTWREYDLAVGNDPDANDGATLVDPDGVGGRIYFQRVPEGKMVKNRVHLDVDVGDSTTIDEEAVRVVELGATYVWRSTDPQDEFIVLTDPEGNEFCLV